MKNKYVFLLTLNLIVQITSAQDSRYFFIRDKDTLHKELPKLYIERDHELILFGSDGKLIYPDDSIINKINSLIVIFRNDTIKFFERSKYIKNENLPEFVSKSFSLDYSYLFRAKKDLILLLDKFPFEENDIQFAVDSQAEIDGALKEDYEAMVMKYQIVSIRVLKKLKPGQYK